MARRMYGRASDRLREELEKQRLLGEEDVAQERPRRRSSLSVLTWYAIVALTIVFVLRSLQRLRQSKELIAIEDLPNGDTLNTLISSVDGGLAPYKLQPLPLGSIKPRGWMQDQLRLMADGLAGHEYDFYPIVKDSPWLGGHSEYAALNEGLPYWFNGLVPLAYGLDDDRLKDQVLDVLEKVLVDQAEDGWLGPEKNPRDQDLWARFPLCLGMMHLAEAEPDLVETIVPALHRFVKVMHKKLQEGIGFWAFWGKVRYSIMLMTLQWLYEKYPRGNEYMLLETMWLLKFSCFDWPGYWTESSFIFADLDMIKPSIEADDWRFRHSHAVNVGQGLTTGASLYRFTKNESLLDANRQGVHWTFQYHGDVAGSILGDERESGVGPNRGSELCTASETLFSLSYLYHVMGDNEFADRCELAAFNAWPVSITANHWARQYLAVANEPSASRIDGPVNFWNAGGEALVYGVETNYPCCTVNMPQGLPKFLSGSFVRVGSDGIGHALLSPASVSTTTGTGVSVEILCDTQYPFGNTLNYVVNASGSFKFYVRVPEWSRSKASIVLDSKEQPEILSPDPLTGMNMIELGHGVHNVTVVLSPEIRVVERGNSSVAIYHGALLYALDVGHSEEFYVQKQSNITHSTLDGIPNIPSHIRKIEISNTQAWNIGIDPDTVTFESSASNKPLSNLIFDYHAPPSVIKGKGCFIKWPTKNGLPIALPALGKGETRRRCHGEIKNIELRPYASLKAHMAELPVVDLKTASE